MKLFPNERETLIARMRATAYERVIGMHEDAAQRDFDRLLATFDNYVDSYGPHDIDLGYYATCLHTQFEIAIDERMARM